MKILFIQHAGTLGGSCMSLLYTMEEMRRLGHECIVGLAKPFPHVDALYRDAGFEVVHFHGLEVWHHSTVAPRPWLAPRSWRMFAKLLVSWRRTRRLLLAELRRSRPDIVHLNSVPLVPFAHALMQEGFPFVWHVREPPPDRGWRTRLIESFLLKAPVLIFISRFDRVAWVQARRGTVIPNFVDPEKFAVEPSPAPPEEPVTSAARPRILFLGGAHPAKGAYCLVAALEELKRRGVPFECVMPGIGSPVVATSPWRRWRMRASYDQVLLETIQRSAVAADIQTLGYQREVAGLIRSCKVLVFPSIKPHFARPVVEATVLERAVVGSDLEGVAELVAQNPWGAVFKAGDVSGMADRIVEALSLPERPNEVELASFARFRTENSATHRCREIEACYEEAIRKASNPLA